eukprot:GHVU01113802.1.p1 GENE.GHVU01113802.1~~GHVU01113802.1.p1  ORF type:complete len:101 (+),score=2.39 GHVU01113802.1:639-941(+)
MDLYHDPIETAEIELHLTLSCMQGCTSRHTHPPTHARAGWLAGSLPLPSLFGGLLTNPQWGGDSSRPHTDNSSSITMMLSYIARLLMNFGLLPITVTTTD